MIRKVCAYICGYHNIEKVKKVRDYAFVHFKTRESAQKVLDNLQGTIMDGCKLYLDWAKPVSQEDYVLHKAMSRYYRQGLPGDDLEDFYFQGTGNIFDPSSRSYRSSKNWRGLTHSYARNPKLNKLEHKEAAMILSRKCQKFDFGPPFYQYFVFKTDGSDSTDGRGRYLCRIYLPHCLGRPLCFQSNVPVATPAQAQLETCKLVTSAIKQGQLLNAALKDLRVEPPLYALTPSPPGYLGIYNSGNTFLQYKNVGRGKHINNTYYENKLKSETLSVSKFHSSPMTRNKKYGNSLCIKQEGTSHVQSMAKDKAIPATERNTNSFVIQSPTNNYNASNFYSNGDSFQGVLPQSFHCIPSTPQTLANDAKNEFPQPIMYNSVNGALGTEYIPELPYQRYQPLAFVSNREFRHEQVPFIDNQLGMCNHHISHCPVNVCSNKCNSRSVDNAQYVSSPHFQVPLHPPPPPYDVSFQNMKPSSPSYM